MPPLALTPGLPLGMPDIQYGYGDDASSVYAGAAGRPGSTTNSGGLSPYEEAILRAYQESGGFARDQLAEQTRQAKAALDYQYAALKQQAKTSKQQLELDRWYKGEQVKLAQRAADLADRQFGLDYAKAETQYLSSPDTMFQARQLSRSASNILNGGTGYGAYRAGGDMEQPNTPEDFKRLATTPGSFPTGSSGPVGSPNPGVTTNSGGAGSVSNLYAPGGGSSTLASTSMAQQAGAPDVRLKAIKAISDALPPSAGHGISPSDTSALTAMHAVYSAPGGGNDMDQADAAGSALLAKNPGDLGLGSYESLLPGTQGALKSLAATKGIYFPDWLATYQRSRPGQSSALAA